ncbi:hypothetical protein P8R33_04990 [Qipengyuania sp. XHP0211]|uniref:hypothetical protein n=1 Tax=Qipengyuania sp. XHP0211 TaxID=3038079 RepID=UPI00241F3E67|nr:hypothetical protein [Qipengyuania sp. XHP0211]MDG5750454.1 hypothetical protein [Qipengyuania sp. XHP0211]
MYNGIRSRFADFATRVRKELALAGHGDVACRTAWLSRATQGDPFQMNVPVASDLVITIRPSVAGRRTARDEDWTLEARAFASALITLDQGKDSLAEYARTMRAAAMREIDSARALGLDIRLAAVGFMPCRAHTLDREDRQEALDYVICEIQVEMTSYSLGREILFLTIEEPEDVPAAVGEHLDIQKERQAREDELEEFGADLEISDISLEILDLTGRPPHEILRDLLERNERVIKLDGDVRIGLTNDFGVVEVSLETEELLWNGKSLQLRNGAGPLEPSTITGKSLGEHISDPVFASRPINFCTTYGGSQSHFLYDEERSYIDLTDGRHWKVERPVSVAA